MGTTSYSPYYAYVDWGQVGNESLNWANTADPCRHLLGSGWRLPTYIEWLAVDAQPQYWSTAAQAYKSELKLHEGGYMLSGKLTGRGTVGDFWSSTQSSVYEYYGGWGTYYTGIFLSITASTSAIGTIEKLGGYAFNVRCLRDTIALELPSVTNADIPTSTMTANSAKATANVTLTGGATVKAKGFCWSTTSTSPTLNDNVLILGSDTGEFTGTMSNLKEGPTYYVRAYATNNVGTAYSPTVTKFKICNPFTIIHRSGSQGAPEDATITYHTISTSVSGQPRCWITQNLGAIQEATTVTDPSQNSAGWYWQFNRLQGYKPAGSSYTPYYAWKAWLDEGNESSDWAKTADPCQQLLGAEWRLPTKTEWDTVYAAPQYWKNYNDAFKSVLKLHASGFMYSGSITNRGVQGCYWSSKQSSVYEYYGGWGTYFTGSYLSIAASSSATTAIEKLGGYAFNVRCLRDTVVLQIPTVTTVTFPTSEMTATTAMGHATVIFDGKSSVTERGFCWSIINVSPSISDSVLVIGNGVGDFQNSLQGLKEGPTYYVRAYAKNSNGIAYSPTTTKFKICNPFVITHVTGVNGAAESKTVTYHTISTSISGAPMCWITQNLGADAEATSVVDTVQVAAGWYWQFNRIQGYRPIGTTSYTPIRATWLAEGNESTGWISANDPCQSLGSGWRLPTSTEWQNVDAQPQYWSTAAQAYNSEIKLHEGGYMLSGKLAGKGTVGDFWSSTQTSAYEYYGGWGTYFQGIFFSIAATTSATAAIEKLGGYAFPVRCLRDIIL